MTLRLIALAPALAALLALPAAAQDADADAAWIVSPALTESSKTAAAQVPTIGLDRSPFYSDIEYRGIAIDEFPDPEWYLRDGADSQYDADPREQTILPRPTPGLTFSLR